MTELYVHAFPTPLGEMVAALDGAGALVRLAFRHGERDGADVAGRHAALGDPGPCARVAERLDAYFRGDPVCGRPGPTVYCGA